MFFSGVFLISVMIVNIVSQDKNKNFVLNVHKDFFIAYDSFKEVNFPKITKKFLPHNYKNDSEGEKFDKLSFDLSSLKNSKNVKDQFIYSILPIVVKKNEEILNNRNKVLKIREFLFINKTINRSEINFIEQMADIYNIKIINRHKIDVIDDLLQSLDVIPNSIVLAQAAAESGWGQSRFAKEYNALFGQYTFDKNKGVVPKFREDGETYLIRFFSTVNDSVESYFKNINTHPAYKNFRKTRYNLREANLNLKHENLIPDLKPYAKDENYIDIISSIIRVNKLYKFDNIKIITTKS